MTSVAKDFRLQKVLIYFLLGFFLLFFVVGFLDLGGWVMISVLAPFLFLSIVLLTAGLMIKRPNQSKSFIIGTGISGIIFSLGVTYGIFGIWGYYEINDMVYIGNVMLSFIGFLMGATGSLYFMPKGDQQSESD